MCVGYMQILLKGLCSLELPDSWIPWPWGISHSCGGFLLSSFGTLSSDCSQISTGEWKSMLLNTG